MKSDLTLNIGTKYDGEGFQKLNGALKTAGNDAKNASKALNGIQQALGSVGGEAGKVVGQLGNIAQGFATMGVAGGIIAGVTAAIQGLFNWLNKANEALNELAKGFGQRLKDAVAGVNREIANTNKEFSKLVNGAKTQAERDNINGNFGLQQMEEQKKRDLAGKEGVEAAKLEAEWNQKIAKAKEAQSKQHLADVREEIRLTEENLKKQEEAQKKARNHYVTLNQLAVDMFNSESQDLLEKNKYADDAQIAKAQMNAYDKPIQELREKLEKLRTAELKAAKDAEISAERGTTSGIEGRAKIEGLEKKEADEKAKQLKADKEKLQKVNEQIADMKENAEVEKKKKELEDRRNKLLEADNKTAEERLKERKEEQKLAKELAEAEQKAAAANQDWADNKQQNFIKWNKQRGDEVKQLAKQERQEQQHQKIAQDEAERIAKRVFDKDGNLKQLANMDDLGRFSNLADYLGFKGVNDEQIQTLQNKRDELQQKLFNEDGTLKKNISPQSKDYQLFKNLNKSLKNIDAKKEAEKKRAEAEQREKEKAKREDERNRELKKIANELNIIALKQVDRDYNSKLDRLINEAKTIERKMGL